MPIRLGLPEFLISLEIYQTLDDFFDRIPAACGGGHAKHLLDLAEVADRFHLSTI